MFDDYSSKNYSFWMKLNLIKILEKHQFSFYYIFSFLSFIKFLHVEADPGKQRISNIAHCEAVDFCQVPS